MKKTLLLSIYTFIFCFCKGQMPDSVWVKYRAGVGIYYDTLHLPKLENDTVQVVMLACDTLTNTRKFNGQVFTTNPPQYGFDLVKDSSLYWLCGYKVYDYKNEQIIYLDEQKNKLSKTIIVWQDIEK